MLRGSITDVPSFAVMVIESAGGVYGEIPPNSWGEPLFLKFLSSSLTGERDADLA
jgi:hypothetical protein